MIRQNIIKSKQWKKAAAWLIHSVLLLSVLLGFAFVFPVHTQAASAKTTKTVVRTFKSGKKVKIRVTSAAKVTYTGLAQKPKVTVKYGKKKLKSGRHYTVKYKKNRNVGKATIIIKGRGKYKKRLKTIKKSFRIVLNASKRSPVKAGNGTFTIRWSDFPADTDGVEIEYTTDKNFRNGKTLKGLERTENAEATLKGLKPGTTYYLRIRTWTKNGRTVTMGEWSGVSVVTTAKTAGKIKDDGADADTGTAGTQDTGTGGNDTAPKEHVHQWKGYTEIISVEHHDAEIVEARDEWVDTSHWESHCVCSMRDCGYDYGENITTQEWKDHMKVCVANGWYSKQVWVEGPMELRHYDAYVNRGPYDLITYGERCKTCDEIRNQRTVDSVCSHQ